MASRRGILGYGTYVPYRRLDRAEIAPVAGKGGGKGTRSVASYDEDTTTMAVEAARPLLSSLSASSRTEHGQNGPGPGTDRGTDGDGQGAASGERAELPPGGAGNDRPSLGALWFATAAPAYLDKTNATAIHAALRLEASVPAFDANGSVRSAMGALRAGLTGDGPSLVVSADMRTGLPGSPDEAAGGDAAAALLVGSEDAEAPLVAELLGWASATDEFLDRWRTPGAASSKVWEERFGEQRYVAAGQQAFADGLKASGLVADDVDHLVVVGAHARACIQLRRKLGLGAGLGGRTTQRDAEAAGGSGSRRSREASAGTTAVVSLPSPTGVQAAQGTATDAARGEALGRGGISKGVAEAGRSDVSAAELEAGLLQTVGFTGAAHPGVALAAVLDEAGPGEVIAVVVLADGADVVVLRTTDALATRRQARPLAAQVAAGAPVAYGTYLAWRGLLPVEPPRRPEPARPSAPAAHRSVDWKFGFVGSQGDDGTVHLPPAPGDTTPVPMAGAAGTIATFTVDKMAYSPSPPVVFAVVDFDGGGRLPVELTDVDVADVRIGERVELTFRKLFTADGIHNYFWKARPVRATDGAATPGGT